MLSNHTPTKPYLVQASQKSIYGSGYNEVKKRKLENVEIPSQIRCKGCKRLKKTAHFSNKQLLDLRNYLALGYTITDWAMLIECRQCTGIQIHEMTCFICDETKGLEEFSKAQRRNPDAARCLACVDDHLYTNPSVEDTDDDENENEDEEDTVMSGGTDGYKHSDDDDDNGGTALGGNEVDTRDRASSGRKTNYHANNSQNDWQGFADQNAKGTPYTGYDSRGVGHPRTKAPSTLSSRAPQLDDMPDSLQLRMGKETRGGKFAKVPAERPVPPQSLRSSAVASSSRQVKYDSESSDDDFGTIG